MQRLQRVRQLRTHTCWLVDVSNSSKYWIMLKHKCLKYTICFLDIDIIGIDIQFFLFMGTMMAFLHASPGISNCLSLHPEPKPQFFWLANSSFIQIHVHDSDWSWKREWIMTILDCHCESFRCRTTSSRDMLSVKTSNRRSYFPRDASVCLKSRGSMFWMPPFQTTICSNFACWTGWCYQVISSTNQKAMVFFFEYHHIINLISSKIQLQPCRMLVGWQPTWTCARRWTSVGHQHSPPTWWGTSGWKQPRKESKKLSVLQLWIQTLFG